MTRPIVRPWVGLRLDAIALAVATAAVLAAVFARSRGVDTSLFLTVNGWRGLPDAVWETLSVAGLGVTALVAFTIPGRRVPRLAATLPWMLAVGGGLTHLVKQAVPMLRPASVLGPASVLAGADVHMIGPKLFLRSMPSGHAMTAFAVVTILFLVGGPLWRRPSMVVASLLIAAAVGVSRVASGVHWPADVAAGVALGWATGAVAVHLAAVTRTEAWLATTAGQWILGATQVGAGVAVAFDQGYGRTLPFQWVLATMAVSAGVRTLSEQRWARAAVRRRVGAPTKAEARG
jgi:membrane-associated phospholipid phosphatase